MRALIAYSILTLFLLSGALPGALIPVQIHAEFATEQDPAPSEREDESTRSSASRKYRNQARKPKPLLTLPITPREGSLFLTLSTSYTLYSSSPRRSDPDLHRLYRVLRI
jgi:hypothetical protein